MYGLWMETGHYFFFYEAGKDKDEGKKQSELLWSVLWSLGFSDGLEYSVLLLGFLSTVLESATRALFPENPLASPFPSALCDSRSRRLHFSPWQLQQLEVPSPLCVLHLSHLIFSATGPVFPLTAPREVLLGRVPFVLREVEGLLTGLQSLQGCKKIQGYKGVGSFLPCLGPSGWLSLVFMETSGVLAFTILLIQKPSSTRIVLY